MKALALKKKNTDMMEADVTQTSSSQDFSENPFGKKKDGEEEDEKDFSDSTDESETEDFACEDDNKEKKKFPFDKNRKNGNDDKQKEEDEDEEGEDYAEEVKGGEEADGTEVSGGEKPGGEEVEGSDIAKLKERLQFVEEELQKQRRMAREKEISDFCESMYAGGKLIESIVPKKELVKFMSTLNGKNSINFSETNRKSQFDFFSGVLNNLPQVVNFSELATEASSPVKNKAKAKDELSGFAYDNKSAEIHAKALDFSESHGVDYITALKSVV
jgi:hypothetical protein